MNLTSYLEQMVNKKGRGATARKNCVAKLIKQERNQSSQNFVRKCIDENEKKRLFTEIIHEINAKLKELEKLQKI